MSDQMQVLTDRTSAIVDALANAILSAAETAAEKVQLAAAVAQIQQRMAAFGSVLEAVGVQREALEARLSNANGPMRALLTRQIELLAHQEIALLERAGAPREVAAKAVETIEYTAPPAPDGKVRIERHLRRKPALNGTANGE